MKDCCDNCKEGNECCSVHEGKFSSTSTKQLVKIFKQFSGERLSGSAALTFRLISKELIKRKAKLESVNERWNPNKIKSHSAKAINFLKQAQQFAKQGQKGAVWNRLKDAGWELKQVMAFTESVNEAVPMGRVGVPDSLYKDLVIPKNQMSKAKRHYKEMMNLLKKVGKSMNQPGEIDTMVMHMESAYDEMLALWKIVKVVKKESVHEAWSKGLERYKVTLENGEAIDVKVKKGKGLEGLEELLGKEGLKFEKITKKASRPTLTADPVNEAVEPKGNMAKVAKIVRSKQAAKLGGVMIDMQSANLLMKLWDAVSDKDKEKMNKLNPKVLTTVIKKLWSRVNLKLPI